MPPILFCTLIESIMEINTVSSVTGKYLFEVFWVNYLLKICVWVWTMFVVNIYSPNEVLIKIVVFLYLADLILWVVKAVKYKIFSSFQFWRWVFKLAVYWILLAIWFSVDKALPFEFVLSLMFSFIIITDASSILENLEQLWFRTPTFLRRILQIHKERFFMDQVEKYTWYNLTNKYIEDIKKMEDFIEMIPDKWKHKIMKSRLSRVKTLIIDITEDSIIDKTAFKIKLQLRLENIKNMVERDINNAKVSKEDRKKCFWYFKRWLDDIMDSVNDVLKVDNKKLKDPLFVEQVKNNIKQIIIRNLYKQISEHIKLKK